MAMSTAGTGGSKDLDGLRETEAMPPKPDDKYEHVLMTEDKLVLEETSSEGSDSMDEIPGSDSMDEILAYYRGQKKYKDKVKRKFIEPEDKESVKREFIKCLERTFGSDGGKKFIGIHLIRQCRRRSCYEFKFECLLTSPEIHMLKGCKEVVKIEVEGGPFIRW